MSFLLVLFWSLIRAIIISSVATWIFLPLKNLHSHQSTGLKKWLPLIAVTPLVIPDLLLGFTYRLASASLNFSNTTTELIYALLLLTKLLSIQVVCQWLVPPSAVSESSIHLWKLSSQTGWHSRLTYLRMILSGPARAFAVAWTLGTLWCFQEFETAALLQIEQHPVVWTVWLFDAKAANEPLESCLLIACPAIVAQGLLIAVCLATLKGQPATSNNAFSENTDSERQTHCRWRTASLIMMSLGVVFAVVWPLLWNSATGIRGLWELSAAATLQSDLKQIAKSTLVAGLSAVGSWMLAKWIFRSFSKRTAVAALLPGLLSPLVLSLLLLAVFLSPVFRPLYDSLLPLVIAQIIWLLPRAFLLCIAFNRQIPSEQIHSARLLKHSGNVQARKQARKLIWILQDRPAWISVTVLLMMAFWEVTINSILHPVSMKPTVCTLYGQMHFGHSEVLAGLTALSIIFPLLTLAALAQIWKLVRQ